MHPFYENNCKLYFFFGQKAVNEFSSNLKITTQLDLFAIKHLEVISYVYQKTSVTTHLILLFPITVDSFAKKFSET